ncbi:MAG: hypothetical protein OXI77_07830 [Chloroflexota bacterium]|nr:hypothetical protein [Chloroflexota bacterium]MDE2910072.1 hypothetical protein [Chloroflexota bacterium]
MDFEQVFQMLVLAVVVLVYWWSYRSFPPGETAKLIERLGEVSQRTESRLDDLLVDIARLLNEMRPPVEEEQPEAQS